MKVILAICLIALGLIAGQYAALEIVKRHTPASSNLDCIISNSCGVEGGGLLMKSEMDQKMIVIPNLRIGRGYD